MEVVRQRAAPCCLVVGGFLMNHPVERFLKDIEIGVVMVVTDGHMQ